MLVTDNLIHQSTDTRPQSAHERIAAQFITLYLYHYPAPRSSSLRWPEFVKYFDLKLIVTIEMILIQQQYFVYDVHTVFGPNYHKKTAIQQILLCELNLGSILLCLKGT